MGEFTAQMYYKNCEKEDLVSYLFNKFKAEHCGRGAHQSKRIHGNMDHRKNPWLFHHD